MRFLLKRQLINREQLSFPYRHGHCGNDHIHAWKKTKDGSNIGTLKAKTLGWAALVAGILSWMRDARATWMPFNIPDTISLPLTLAGVPLKTWTLALKVELIQVGAGVLMSFRTAWSMLLGGLITYAVIAPRLVETKPYPR